VTTKKVKTEEKKPEDSDKEVDVNAYKGEHDEDSEGQVPESTQAADSKVQEVAAGKIDLETTKHFETKDEEFQKIIASLPTFTREDEQRIAKSYGDKRAAWELGHIHDSHFPIRFKVVKGDPKDEFIQYEMEEETKDGKIYKSFKTEEKYFEGQSLTPAHKDKLISMENEESIFFTKLDTIQRDIEHVVTVRNTVGTILNISNKKTSKVTEDELKSYMKKMDDAMKKLPENLSDTIRKIKNDADTVTQKKNRFIAYAYFGITEEEYPHVFVNDIRDYAGVIQRRDNLRVPS
jgi:hypothetical protein